MLEMGHEFLARMGKTRLRPGGKIATEWLFEHSNLNAESKVLEVACNMGTTMIEIAKRYGCSVIGLDMSREALSHAKENIAKAGLEDKITVVEGNALELPFEDNSFDVVINEAMLTMQKGELKSKCIEEYKRVLKPGGVLLTHDVAFTSKDEELNLSLRKELSRAINADVEPLTIDKWIDTFESARYEVEESHGDMTLMSPKGMIQDEGIGGMAKVIRNALKPKNKAFFKKMYSFFNNNSEYLNYIAVCSKKVVA